MKKLSLGVLATLLVTLTFGQGVSINPTGNNPDTSAMLDVSSTSKGLLLPRLTTVQRDAISLPATGLLVYNTTTSTFDYYSGTAWFSLSTASSVSTVPIIRTYTSNATWTKPPGLKYIIVEMVGGGGGGGGCYNYGGGAGAGAGYCKKIIATSSLSSTESVLIGIGGSGGSPQNPGLDGGTSSFGSHCSATGGQGGKAQTSAVTSTDGSYAGIGINGDINLTGINSGGATSSGQPLYCGASSFFGGGASSPASTLTRDGLNATGYGSGASGANGYNNPFRTGGNGSSGIVIITEYY
jgi:hypothetical protein